MDTIIFRTGDTDQIDDDLSTRIRARWYGKVNHEANGFTVMTRTDTTSGEENDETWLYVKKKELEG